VRRRNMGSQLNSSKEILEAPKWMDLQRQQSILAAPRVSQNQLRAMITEVLALSYSFL
jgi:hypothetical protein